MKALTLLVVAGCAFEAPITEEGVPEVTFAIDRSLVDETVGTTELQLNLSKKSGEAVIVQYDALDGDGVAEASTDFSFVVASREVTIPPGETRAVIPVKILNNDELEESEEHVEIELTLVQHAVLGATRRHTLRISDKNLPRARFSLASSAELENGPAQNFRILLDTPPETDVVLQQVLDAGTAEAGDHRVVNGMITIPRGQLSAEIRAEIQDDLTDEDDETFDVTLSGLEGVVVVADSNQHVHTIADNDNPPQIGFTVATSATSEAVAAQLEVKLALASEKDISVDYVVIGGTAGLADFTLASGTLLFPAGTIAKTIDVAITNDELDELDETAVVELSTAVNATLGTTQHTLTINDNDDPPAISFMQGTSTVSEGAGASQVQVVLSGPSGRNIQFSLTTGGTATTPGDLTLPALPLTIPAGETSATITSTITNDTTDEVNETVTLTLANVVLATPAGTTTHTITITDNDDAPSLRFDPAVGSRTVDEGDSGQLEFSYPVVLSAASSKTVTVSIDGNDGDATSQDFEYGAGSLALTFLPGEISKAVRVIVFGDPSLENDNDVRMRLLTPMNASNAQDNQSRTHTINNDD